MDAAPVVFRYLDYRAYLRDHFAHRRSVGRLSHRAFAQKAGFRSPNFLKLVMDGQRSLHPRSVEAVAKACRLDVRGRRYLGELVALGRARSSADRVRILDRVFEFEERIELFPLERSAADYFGTWWVPVVRELSAVDGFRPDPAWIAECLGGRITEPQAQRALETLDRLGLLRDADSSRLDAVTSGDELQSVAMKRYHGQLLGLAGEAIESTPPSERDVSAITITGDEATFREAKRMIQRFRKELLVLERRAKSRDRVYQFCLQLFPVATAARRDRDEETP
jgi:uncharacterized protein (TIGR02147 family)